MDLAISILLGVIQAAFGLFGALVSLGANWSVSARKKFAALFLLLTLVAIGLLIWQAVRAAESNEATRKLQLGDPERPPSVAAISLPGNTRFVVDNSSDYPAYGVRIRLLDDTSPTQPVIVRDWNYPEIPAHTGLMDDNRWIPPDSLSEHHFSATITSRTGIVSEELILRKSDNDQWMRAARVRRGERTLEEDVDSAWPRNAKGQVDWR